MAYRYRSRWSRGADVFPQRVAIGAIVLLALFITLAVWGLLPAEGGPAVASVEPADRADQTEPAPADPPPPVLSRVEPPADPPHAVLSRVESGPGVTTPPAPPVASASPRATPDEAAAAVAPREPNEVPTAGPRAVRPRVTNEAGTPTPPRRVAGDRNAARPAPAPEPSALRVTTAAEEGSAGATAIAEWRFGAAAVHFQRAVTLEPRNATFRTGYARALFHHGALAQAAAQLEAAVSWNPAHADAFALLGEVRWAQDQRARAEQAYRRYLELEPDARRRASAEARLRRITGQDAVASGSRLR
jgi:hypothetical protein